MKKLVIGIISVALCACICSCAGKSAYEIAVEHGFVGSESEWLESLKGADGKDGRDGASGAMGYKGESGDKGDKGDKGDTGEKGEDGKDGKDGENGKDGKDGVGVEKTEIAPNGHLIITLTNGTVIDAGYVRGDLEDTSSEAPVLSVTELSLLTGDTYIISSDRPVRYESDNESAVLVASNGFVVAVGEGTAKITATASDGKTSVCEVTAAPFEAKLKADNTYVITGYNGFAEKLSIPSRIKGLPVSEIAAYAMWDNQSLVELFIPESVKAIGNGAFAICENLKKVTLSEGLTELGDSAFSSCISLAEIDLPASLVSIGGAAFSSCEAIESIVIPDKTEFIGGSAFSGCYSLASVTFGVGVKTIEMMAFDSCTSLTEIALPDSVTFIGEYAFASCEKLSSVKLGAGIKNIPYHAFYECESLENITIPATVKSISDEAFAKCAALAEVTFEGEPDYTLNAFLDTPYQYGFLADELGYIKVDKTMWTKSSGINVRDGANANGSEVVGFIEGGEEVNVIFEIPESTWVAIIFEGSLRYVNSAYLSATAEQEV